MAVCRLLGLLYRLRKRATAAVEANNDLSLSRGDNGGGDVVSMLQLLGSPSIGTRLVVSAQGRTRIVLSSSGELFTAAIYSMMMNLLCWRELWELWEVFHGAIM